MASEEVEDKKKPHRERHAGRKAEKKAKKKDKGTGEKQRNPKAFGFNSAAKAEKRFRRTQDIETKRQHIPLVDRTPVEPPPVIVAVVGPPKVGKSTLIQCLIKNFTRQPLTSLKGPVTIVSGKKRRLTIMECNNDINCMIDIAKVADLVLLLVDASFGFEMEIFEFLNICQVHGMPRIMGVLTHLDMLRRSNQLKRVKKTLKHRLWTEVYAGAKLFYLSGLLHGEYLRNEVKNLGRFISVMKFRPLVWRTSHPYLLVDRLEDITSPETVRQNPVVDREICLYGYVRGIPLNKNYSIHIPGGGDFKLNDVTYLPDPCPLPDKEKRRSLIEKERLIYAPFSGVGGIVYDKDAVYVELGGSHSHSHERKTSELVNSLMEVQEPLDKKMAHSELQLFSGAEPITSADVLGKSNRYHEESVYNSGRNRRKVVFENSIDGASSEGDDDVTDEEGMEVDSEEDYENDIIFDENESGEGDDDDDEDENNDNNDEEEDSNNNDTEREKIVEVKRETTESGINGKQKLTKRIKSKISSSTKREGKTKKKYIWEDDEYCENNTNPAPTNQEDSDFKSPPIKKQICESSIENNISKKHQKKNQISAANAKLILAMGDVMNEDISDDDEIHSEGLCQEKSQGLIPSENARIHRKQNVDVTNKISECLALLEKKADKKTEKKLSADFSEGESESGSSSDEMYNDFMNNDNKDYESDKNSSNSEDEGEVVESSAIQWKSNLTERAANAFLDRQANRFSLWKLVYGEDKRSNLPDKDEGKEEEDDLGGLFRKVTKEQKQLQEERDLQDGKDCSKTRTTCGKDWNNPQSLLSITDCFVTGKWKESEDAEELLRLDDASVSGDSDVFGDFEDLETGEKHVAEKTNSAKLDSKKEDSADLSSLSKAELVEKKKKLKAKFDAEYDEGEGGFTYYDELKQEVSRQAEINKSEFEGMDEDLRVQLEGFRPGMYVRVELSNVPCELVTNFDPTFPLIIGGLLTGEENVGYVQVRIKKHRWHSRILKNCDPLIVSLGWRRFQTIPVFAKLEDNLRHRMLKYTPEHIACMAHFWGPITPQGSGFLALQDVANKEPGFRIAATGSVVELDKSVQVMKKLKLTGVPMKIYRKTAFIRGMFNSSLEVAKFEGAKLRTVSGIRGQIKRAFGKPEGSFRATFEDKILLSDIVFCRTWYRVEIPRLYNPVMSLLLPPDQKNAWQGMKTVGQLKREKGIRCEPALDSLYTPIEREPKVFPPLVIPRKLQKMLPYKSKPKVPVSVSAKRQVEKKRIAVVRDPKEQKVAHLIKALKVAYNAKQRQDKSAVTEKKAERKKLLEKEEMRMLKRRKELRKQVFRTLDKLEQKKTAEANTKSKKKTKSRK
ncbi:Uncharacterized protein GBIM_05961 [Gryllus bimaculatus]|nr:Uncharacterized protein GBIM_05961 [Gryllus bimaculatus]